MEAPSGALTRVFHHIAFVCRPVVLREILVRFVRATKVRHMRVPKGALTRTALQHSALVVWLLPERWTCGVAVCPPHHVRRRAPNASARVPQLTLSSKLFLLRHQGAMKIKDMGLKRGSRLWMRKVRLIRQQLVRCT